MTPKASSVIKGLVTALLVAMIAIMSACQHRGVNQPLQVPETAIAEEISSILSRQSHIVAFETEVRKIVQFSDSSSFSLFGRRFSLPGRRDLIIPIVVNLKYAVDLRGFTAECVEIDDSLVTVRLPEPEMYVASSDVDWQAEKSDVSFYRSEFTAREKEKFLNQAVDNVIADFESRPYVAEYAKRSASAILRPLIMQMGYSEQNVSIVFVSAETPIDRAKRLQLNGLSD